MTKGQNGPPHLINQKLSNAHMLGVIPSINKTIHTQTRYQGTVAILLKPVSASQGAR